jgi:hypothetical protein
MGTWTLSRKRIPKTEGQRFFHVAAGAARDAWGIYDLAPNAKVSGEGRIGDGNHSKG